MMLNAGGIVHRALQREAEMAAAYLLQVQATMPPHKIGKRARKILEDMIKWHITALRCHQDKIRLHHALGTI